jgi:hypothetical protein
MLVKINTQVGGVSTDQKTRWFNFMSSLHAVATAAAGTTPVVNPVNTSAVKNTGFNCITVLSNAEGGGWNTGVSNTITAATTYNANGSAYNVDLYNNSGKTTYPYYRIGFVQPYSFAGGSFTSYPFITTSCGHTNLDPTTTALTSDTVMYQTGNATGFNGSNNITIGGGSYTSYPQVCYPRVDIDYVTNSASQTLGSTEIFVASTSGYLIIATPYDMWYFGTRTVSPWELSRTDNPPWVGFGWSCGAGSTPSYGMGNNGASHYHAWTSLISSDLTVNSAPRRLGMGDINSSLSTYGHHLTGMDASTTIKSQPNSSVNSGLMPATHPLLYPNAVYYGTGISPSYSARWDNMVTDTTTGQQVPPAYPLVFNAFADVSSGNPNTTYQTAQGIIQGILRGPTQTPAGLNAMLTASDYTIGSSTYVPVRIGPGNGTFDCFFLRKA